MIAVVLKALLTVLVIECAAPSQDFCSFSCHLNAGRSNAVHQ